MEMVLQNSDSRVGLDQYALLSVFYAGCASAVRRLCSLPARCLRDSVWAWGGVAARRACG